MTHDYVLFIESVKHAYSHITTPQIQYLTPFGGEKSILSLRVLTIFGELQQMPGGQHAEFPVQWKRGKIIHVSIWVSDPIWYQACSMVWTPSWAVRPWPSHPVVPEQQPCHVLCGAWHCPGRTQSFNQKQSSPREEYCRGEAWEHWRLRVSSITTSSLLPSRWISPHIMT